MEERLIEFLGRFVTAQRLENFITVINNRTRYITVILEDIYQSQNASAVLRTCECFGIQDVHVIEIKNKFCINPRVTLGSSNWLNINKYDSDISSSAEAIKDIKSKGYRIIAASQVKNNQSLDNLDLSKGKVAFIFGSEQPGLSEDAKMLADETITIPMFGFTESFNISVSASIILYSSISKLRRSDIEWKLTREEKNYLMLHWLKSSIKKSDLLVKKFFEKS